MDGSGIIYLVRHCATKNDEASYPVLLGTGARQNLSDAGVKQAKALAVYFAGKGVNAIYSSTEARAVQTARRITDCVEVPVTFCASLKEADMGSWEGLTYDHVMREDVSNYNAFLSDPGTYGYPNGENFSQICRRALRFIEGLAEQHPDQRIVVISHEYVNRAVLAHFMALPMVRAREIDQSPGCVNVIRVFRGTMELQAVNYTSTFELADEETESCDTCSTTPVVSE